jgi:hypothetical protein
VQMIFFRPNTPHDEAVPWTLDAINGNGLGMFLLVCSLCASLTLGKYSDGTGEYEY